MGTDLEVGIRIEVPGIDVEAPGSHGLAHQPFPLHPPRDQRRKVAPGERRTENMVRGQRSQFQLPSENPDEFPPIKEFEETQYHELPARLFREVVRRTGFATDNESSRYALGGVLMELTAERSHGRSDRRPPAGAAGGARPRSIGESPDGPNATIIPTRAMTLLDRALSDSEGDIQLAARDNDVLVRSGRA